jgi:hypothetical protein
MESEGCASVIVNFKILVDTEFGDSVFVTGNIPVLGMFWAYFEICAPRRKEKCCNKSPSKGYGIDFCLR